MQEEEIEMDEYKKEINLQKTEMKGRNKSQYTGYDWSLIW